MKYKRISDFPKSQAESISVLGVEDGHNVQMEVLSKKATLQNIQKGVANKANKDGNHPKMTAGFAQEIVGDGSATPEEFSFRPTAGEERNVANTTYYDGERNGVARIEKIKGNSVVWNKPIRNEVDSSGTGKNGWYNRGGGNVQVTFNGDLITQISNTSATNIQLSQNIGFKSNHIYYILWEWDYPEDAFTLESNNEIRFRQISDRNGVNGVFISYTNKPKGFLQKLYTSTRDDLPFISIGTRLHSFLSNASYVFKNRTRVVDLTKMFGAGNEPTTVEEFYQRLPVGIDISEYNEGTIIDGNYGGIKTVGFNAFNGTYAKVCAGCPYYLGGNYTSLGFTTEEGGTLEAITLPTSAESVGTTPSDRLYTPSQNGYIYAEGENININISWDTEYGYLNGTYQPYKPFERDLSWIGRIKDSNGNLVFPNGMRSAGSVRDEIRFNSSTQKWEAVQNVGVVDLGSLRYTAISERTNTYRAIGNIPLKEYVVDLFTIHIVSTYNTGLGDYYWTNDEVGVCDLVNSNTRGIVVGVAKNGVSGTSESIATALQGVMLNYELDTPIITEIAEDINMDFDVSDYGTEELIAQEGKASAPIVADITYAPNALSTLKQVPDILKRLKALESAVASATATINEEEIVE